MLFELSGQFNDCLEYIKRQHERDEKTIQYLRDKIKELEEEHYKDKLVAKYKERAERVHADAMRGFTISEKQREAIDNWIDKHEEEKHPHPKGAYPRGGAIGGSYTYHFTPTSIGTFGSIRCTCGEEFTFQEEW